MKRFLWCLALAGLLPVLAWGEVKYVQVAKTRLLEKPSAFSRAKGQLVYRDQVEILEKKGTYYRVQTNKGSGFVPATSLSVQKPHYSASLSKDYVSSEEVAMATKGFNAQVESEYRRQNPNLPFASLDHFEKQTTFADPNTQFKNFRKQGQLGEFSPKAEGGAEQ
jgi:hypothetical protein